MTINDLMAKLHLTAKNPRLIANAFIHRSFLNETKDWSESNERLEYLGDAVIELATSRFLYFRYPDLQEGMLTNLRAALVRTSSLAEISKTLGLNDLLCMSKGEEASGGRDNMSLLADCFEAFIGAVYLDSGYEAANSILENYLFPKIEAVVANTTYKDKKSELQEFAQASMHATPKYVLVSESGPDHDKVFTMQVVIGDQTYGIGSGKSKQQAQEEAAKKTLEIINNN